MSFDGRNYNRHQTMGDANNSRSIRCLMPPRTGVSYVWEFLRWCLFFGVLALAWHFSPEIRQFVPKARAYVLQGAKALGHSEEPFPATGDVKWFVPRTEGAMAPLTIRGADNATKNIVVKLDDWNSGETIVLIPIRGGETAKLEIPLGRYRMTAASGAREGGMQMGLDAHEALKPIEFFRTATGISGVSIDLNGRFNGNLKMKPVNAISAFTRDW